MIDDIRIATWRTWIWRRGQRWIGFWDRHRWRRIVTFCHSPAADRREI